MEPVKPVYTPYMYMEPVKPVYTLHVYGAR